MEDKFKLDNQLCFRLYSASRLLTRVYTPLLAEQGLTYPRYLVLMVLWEKDAMPVNDIAKRLYLETNTVTPLLKRMENEGLVTRYKGADDGRQMIVRLTPKGYSMRERLASVPDKVGAAALCESVTTETVPALFKTLDDIIGKLKS